MRVSVTVTAATAVLILAGCGGGSGESAPNVPPLVSVSTTPTETASETPSETPSPPPTAKVADTLCVRMNQSLVRTTLAVPVVTIQPKAVPAEIGLPSFDICQLALSTNPSGPVLRLGVSVLPSTKADLSAARQAYVATKGEPPRTLAAGQGGYVTSKFAVFLLGNRLFKVEGPAATQTKYVVLAQEAARQAAGLPEAAPLITRPECERGTSAAAKVMGAEAMARRDSQTPAGDVVCGWITATSVLSTTARRVPDAEAAMATVRKAPTSQSVPLGDEGYVDTATGRGTIRVGTDKIADLVPLPGTKVKTDDMVAFALAISPLYTR
ncbi:hypothetical protein BWI15_29420 [Kribbella sp. ALI-6-A]|uniref:hypothetical protein n=1 Tax=Kribbella sp. ALI-6-A TaxID=1933817 RepID=UPI00097BF79B|nr:hypothetical protein [Kribbella sp. ALI-6-A]ONI67272.1 hypothetical protein BWI15_29420 [Kribbella sp. ALI-6-A]